MPPVTLSVSVLEASVSCALPGRLRVTVPTARSRRPEAIGIERLLVDRHLVVVARLQCAVRQVDGQRRGREVAVAVLDRVDEHVGGVRVNVVGRRLVGVAAVGIEMQRAVQACDVGADTGRHQRGEVAAGGANPGHPAARRKTVGARHVVRQHTRCRHTVSSAPSFTLFVSNVAVGVSSTMSTKMVAVLVLPVLSVTW